MIITTSHNIEGRKISEYLGIVSGVYMTALPGGNKMMQRGWKAGVEGVLEVLKNEAEDLGADAVIAVSMELNGMNLCGIGTAVKLVKE